MMAEESTEAPGIETAQPAVGQSAAPATQSQPSGVKVFEHDGLYRELLELSMFNLLYKLVTAGIFHFWAKNRVRKYLWSHTSISGERLEYTGTGFEMFRGFVLVIVLFLPPVGAYGYFFWALVNNPPESAQAFGANMGWIILGFVTLYAYFQFLYGVGTFSAHRYRLSRTRWRSIRFGVSGSALNHG